MQLVETIEALRQVIAVGIVSVCGTMMFCVALIVFTREK